MEPNKLEASRQVYAENLYRDIDGKGTNIERKILKALCFVAAELRIQNENWFTKTLDKPKS